MAGLLLTDVARATAPQSADQFTRMLYVKLDTDPTFHWSRYLSARTGSLYRRYEARSSGEAGAYLDFDWLCQCQDPGGIRIVTLALTTPTKTTATANVSFKIGGSPAQRVTIGLVYEKGWKIDEITNPAGMQYSRVLRTAGQP